MSDYIPSNRLRFVLRNCEEPMNPGLAFRILQQWWHLPDDGSPIGDLNAFVGEWRDVPQESDK